MTLIKSISGIRGTIGGTPGDALTPIDLVKFTASYCQWLKENTPKREQKLRVVVGRDARLSSPEIREYLIAGITDAGADVTDIGLATTPMVYYATASYGFKASVQITASHNTKEYNGMKVSAANALPVGKENGLALIEQWINEGKECKKSEKKEVSR